jgi:hypothetical protein
VSYNPYLNDGGWAGGGERSPYDIEHGKHKRKMPNYRNSRNRLLNFLYKLFLNLFALSLIGLIIWSGIKLFSQHAFLSSQTTGSIIFIVEIVVFLIVARLNFKTRRQPNMPVTVLTLAVLFSVFAFAGVEPMSTYKGDISTYLNKTFNSQSTNPVVTGTAKTTTSAQTSVKYPSGTYTGVSLILTQLHFSGGNIMTMSYGTSGITVETFKFVWVSTNQLVETFVATDVIDNTQKITLRYNTQYSIITVDGWADIQFSKS